MLILLQFSVGDNHDDMHAMFDKDCG